MADDCELWRVAWWLGWLGASRTTQLKTVSRRPGTNAKPLPLSRPSARSGDAGNGERNGALLREGAGAPEDRHEPGPGLLDDGRRQLRRAVCGARRQAGECLRLHQEAARRRRCRLRHQTCPGCAGSGRLQICAACDCGDARRLGRVPQLRRDDAQHPHHADGSRQPGDRRLAGAEGRATDQAVSISPRS